MRITEQIYVIGSGRHGFQLSHSLDCNVYLLDCGGEYAMIDAGSGMEPERIIEVAQQDGIDFGKITTLLLTHAHGDHAAGAHYFQHRYNMRVVAAAAAAAWLEAGDMEKTSLNVSKRAGHYPDDYRLQPVTVTQSVTEGDEIQIAGKVLKVVDTPGHASGHVAYVLESGTSSTLFSGDAIFAAGRVFVQPTWDCSIPEYAATVAKLNELRIDRLFAGHGPFLMNEAWQHIELAHQTFQRGELPLNL